MSVRGQNDNCIVIIVQGTIYNIVVHIYKYTLSIKDSFGILLYLQIQLVHTACMHNIITCDCASNYTICLQQNQLRGLQCSIFYVSLHTTCHVTVPRSAKSLQQSVPGTRCVRVSLSPQPHHKSLHCLFL